MNRHEEHLTAARLLRSEILDAGDVWLPRREDLLAWLDGFIARARAANYELGETEVADLAALNSFLRRRRVPATIPA